MHEILRSLQIVPVEPRVIQSQIIDDLPPFAQSQAVLDCATKNGLAVFGLVVFLHPWNTSSCPPHLPLSGPLNGPRTNLERGLKFIAITHGSRKWFVSRSRRRDAVLIDSQCSFNLNPRKYLSNCGGGFVGQRRRVQVTRAFKY